MLKLRFQTSLVGVILRPVLSDMLSVGLSKFNFDYQIFRLHNMLNHRSKVFEDVSNLGHTGVVFTYRRIPFELKRRTPGSPYVFSEIFE